MCELGVLQVLQGSGSCTAPSHNSAHNPLAASQLVTKQEGGFYALYAELALPCLLLLANTCLSVWLHFEEGIQNRKRAAAKANVNSFLQSRSGAQ